MRETFISTISSKRFIFTLTILIFLASLVICQQEICKTVTSKNGKMKRVCRSCLEYTDDNHTNTRVCKTCQVAVAGKKKCRVCKSVSPLQGNPSRICKTCDFSSNTKKGDRITCKVCEKTFKNDEIISNCEVKECVATDKKDTTMGVKCSSTVEVQSSGESVESEETVCETVNGNSVCVQKVCKNNNCVYCNDSPGGKKCSNTIKKAMKKMIKK